MAGDSGAKGTTVVRARVQALPGYSVTSRDAQGRNRRVQTSCDGVI